MKPFKKPKEKKRMERKNGEKKLFLNYNSVLSVIVIHFTEKFFFAGEKKKEEKNCELKIWNNGKIYFPTEQEDLFTFLFTPLKRV